MEGCVPRLSARVFTGTFAYRVDVDPFVLLGASLIGLAIANGTVLAQTWRAAVLDPAVALRYE